ncbi:hypothetical protein [Dyella sp. AD56]|uniref:hypothetical protein n=1 Tax=Dyella sp. AD56 TaxID=1528744 RepID=UPI0011AEEF18|nr:hypothetical protein [Dyella sp. AD56]
MPKAIQGMIIALALAGGGLAWRLIYLHYATETINQALADVSRQQIELARKQQEQVLEAQRVRQQEAATLAEQRKQALQLAPEEQCIGGTVIQVSGNVYTQVAGLGGRPQACAGRQRVDLR